MNYSIMSIYLVFTLVIMMDNVNLCCSAWKFPDGGTNRSYEAIASIVEDHGTDRCWIIWTFVSNWCWKPSFCFSDAASAFSSRAVFWGITFDVGGLDLQDICLILDILWSTSCCMKLTWVFFETDIGEIWWIFNCSFVLKIFKRPK